MPFPGRQTLTVFRNDPLYLVISVVGFELSGAAPSFAVRLYPDAPGLALIMLDATAESGKNGCRIVSVTFDGDDIPTTVLEIVASKDLMGSLPSASEAGADLTLSYDLQWTMPADAIGFSAGEERIMFGDLVVKDSFND